MTPDLFNHLKWTVEANICNLSPFTTLFMIIYDIIHVFLAKQMIQTNNIK